MYQSNAKWPLDAYKGPYGDGISTDKHRSMAAAQAVCDGLKREGLGGEGKLFPLETWVTKLPEQRPTDKRIDE